jgi:hypothetical protein
MNSYISSTYLKGIDDYIYYQYSTKNTHIAIKKFLKAEPFIINEDGHDLKIIDNNYYLMEVIPMDSNYICRIHLDSNKRVIEKYFLLSLKNEFIDNIPVFRNLKTAYVICDFQKKIYNEEYLDKLLEDKQITNLEYNNIKTNLLSLIDEINNGKNEIMNIDYKKIIEIVEGI